MINKKMIIELNEGVQFVNTGLSKLDKLKCFTAICVNIMCYECISKDDLIDIINILDRRC